MTKALINSIYLATEGEGLRLGTPQIFVRFQGCAIGCANCDSMETWDFDESMAMELDAIVAEIKRLGDKRVLIKNVSITGGDPLHPKHVAHVYELTLRLKKEGYFVNIEASGSRIVPEIFEIIDFISFDFKTPSTQVRTNPNLIAKLVHEYPDKFQIKSVVSDKKDFEASFDALEYVRKLTGKEEIPWFVTPCYEPGEAFPMDRVVEIMRLNEDYGAPFRVVGQQHKFIFGPDLKRI